MKKTILVLLSLFFANHLFAAEDNLYKFLWLDQDKKVYVLQKKLFPKKMRVFFDAGGLYRFSNPYQTTFGVQGNLDFFFTEQIGIEVRGGYYFNRDNNTYTNIVNKIIAETNDTIKNLLPYIINYKWDVGGMILFAPFYGKINTFNQIIYFDLYFGLGASYIKGESNYKKIIDNSGGKDKATQMEEETYYSGDIKVALKFYLNKNFSLGVDYLHRIYRANLISENKEEKKGFYNESDVILKLGVSF